ncbi:MAG: ABC transporter ATP-binding protein [Thermoplasmatota archaeon]
MNLLEVRDLRVRIREKEVLKGVDLSIPKGELHSLFGPNGCGKSTLIKAIMGFSGYHVTNGSILFDGEEINDLTITERAKKGIGIALQNPPAVPGVTLGKMLEIASFDNDPGDMPERMEVEKFLERDVNSGLSGGEAKRAELAQMVAMAPRFTMLDEPESGVDIENVYLVARAIDCIMGRGGICEKVPIRERETSGLMITHTGEVLQFLNADKGHVMIDGEIRCSGNPREILRIIRKDGYRECEVCPAC